MLKTIRQLRNSEVKRIIDMRLAEFESFKDKPTEDWFKELCFCILTANSKAETALKIEAELGAKGFCECSLGDVRACIIKHKHRFHNHKSAYIMAAREHLDIKAKVQSLVKSQGEEKARDWIISHIKGLGYKEASHFMRNVGYKGLAILDRHILRLMHDQGYIPEVPKPVKKTDYLEIEKIFRKIAKGLKMSAAELDLYMWYIKTGRVLK
jgi:N-glycosylase/DNA lyase